MKLSRFAFLCAGVLLVPASFALAQTDATWTGGGGNGLYSNPANWDIALVPLNDIETYNVFISDPGLIEFDVDLAGIVTDLSLLGAQTLQINPGHSLSVLDDATINGIIAVQNSTFSAIAPGASFGTSNNARLYAQGGGQIALGATVYSSSGLAFTTPLFASEGTGTLIDLSALQSLSTAFDDGWGGVNVHTISATAEGAIDLSSLVTITTPVRGEDRLDFVMSDGGTIDLLSLEVIDSIGGQVRFSVDTPTFSLPVQSLENTVFDMLVGSTLDLPNLETQIGGNYTVSDGAVVNANNLVWMDGLAIDIHQGGTFNAMSLTAFTNCSLDLGADQVFNAPPLLGTDRSRFSVSDGATFAVASSEYTSAGIPGTYTLFSAQGIGSLLDLSSIQSITTAFDDGWGGVNVQTIRATASGVVDLSSLNTIVSPIRGEDRLDIVINSGGNVDLMTLHMIDSVGGVVRFDIDLTSYALPLLAIAEKTTFDLTPGLALSLPSLTTFSGVMTIPSAATVTMPAITWFDSTTLAVEAGGSLSAPGAVAFTGGSFTIDAGQILDLPVFLAIDNSVFDISGGVTFAVGAPDYSSTGRPYNATLLNIRGLGTIADFSSLQEVNAGWDDGWGGVQVHTITAAESALLNLSSVQAITAPVRGEDRVDINVNSGAAIDLSSLAALYGGGDVRFNASGNGTLLDLSSLGIFDQPSQLTMTSASTVLLDSFGVVGSGTFSSTSDVFGYPAITVAGSVQNHTAAEPNFRTGDLELTIATEYATLEAASFDDGIIAPPVDSFELGELTFIPPSSRQEPLIVCVENFDNGNRPDAVTPEAIYITGHEDLDGIQGLGGGTLVMNGLNVYVYDTFDWINLQDLVPAIGAVPYKDGFIANRLATTLGDTNGDQVVDILDLLAVLAFWGTTHPVYDLNSDGIVDILDLLAVLANWT